MEEHNTGHKKETELTFSPKQQQEVRQRQTELQDKRCHALTNAELYEEFNTGFVKGDVLNSNVLDVLIDFLQQKSHKKKLGITDGQTVGAMVARIQTTAKQLNAVFKQAKKVCRQNALVFAFAFAFVWH